MPRTLHELYAVLPNEALDLLEKPASRGTRGTLRKTFIRFALDAGLTEDEILLVDKEANWSHSGRLTVRDQLEALRERVINHKWTGRTGGTDRAVALALVSWAYEVGVWHLDANERDLAIRAGVGKGTAHRALERLREAGLCSPVAGSGGPMNARTWEMNLQWGAKGNKLGHIKPVGGTSLVNVVQFVPTPGHWHPAFLPSALGRTAGMIYESMPEDLTATVTAEEVADNLGCHVKTARRNLRRLVDHGLLVSHPGKPITYGHSDAGSELLDEIAEEYGVTDWASRAADRVVRERRAHDIELQQWAKKSAGPSEGNWERVVSPIRPVQRR